MTVETIPATVPDTVTEVPPWQTATDRTGTVSTTLHILASEVEIAFGPDTYPSLDIRFQNGDGTSGTFYLSLTGDAEQRRDAALALREVAAAIREWEPR